MWRQKSFIPFPPPASSSHNTASPEPLKLHFTWSTTANDLLAHGFSYCLEPHFVKMHGSRRGGPNQWPPWFGIILSKPGTGGFCQNLFPAGTSFLLLTLFLYTILFSFMDLTLSDFLGVTYLQQFSALGPTWHMISFPCWQGLVHDSRITSSWGTVVCHLGSWAQQCECLVSKLWHDQWDLFMVRRNFEINSQVCFPCKWLGEYCLVLSHSLIQRWVKIFCRVKIGFIHETNLIVLATLCMRLWWFSPCVFV